MKKQIMSASVIALMIFVTSCAKNETLPEASGGENLKTDQISFRSSTGKTRANNNGLTQVEGGFNVVGLKADGEYITGFADPVGSAETYLKKGGIWTWDVTPTGDNKKWPTEIPAYPLVFFAAYPKTVNIKKDATTSTITATTNMTPNTGYIYNTYFEKIANTITASNVTTDYLAAMTKVNTKPANGFADLSFKHIMSNISFAIEVPADLKAVVHSIKIANVNKDGRSYNYKTQSWSAESYTTANHTHYAYFVATDAATAQDITSTNSEVKGFAAGSTGYYTLKLMPQTSVKTWAFGASDTEVNSFRKDAIAWSTKYPVVNTEAITAWHMSNTADAAVGMKDSKGWEGARIEVIYCLVDTKTNKNLVGSLAGTDGALTTQYVRVGYPLNIANIDTKGDGSLMGLHPGYKYKFTISLGTIDATNGILLDPDYKDVAGDSTDTPVDNPTGKPGDLITKDGVIDFNVIVEPWAEYNGNIK